MFCLWCGTNKNLVQKLHIITFNRLSHVKYQRLGVKIVGILYKLLETKQNE